MIMLPIEIGGVVNSIEFGILLFIFILPHQLVLRSEHFPTNPHPGDLGGWRTNHLYPQGTPFQTAWTLQHWKKTAPEDSGGIRLQKRLAEYGISQWLNWRKIHKIYIDKLEDVDQQFHTMLINKFHQIHHIYFTVYNHILVSLSIFL